MVESVESRVLCDGAPGVQEEPATTMPAPDAPGPGTDLTFSPDPLPAPGPDWTVGWVDRVRELQVELLGPTTGPGPVSAFD